MRGALALAASGFAPIALDYVPRADSATSAGTAEIGGAWTAVVGTWGVASRKIKTVTHADGDNATLWDISVADMWVHCRVDYSTGDFIGVKARTFNNTTFYLAHVNPSTNAVVIFKDLGGSFTQLATTGSSAITSGKRLGLSVKGGPTATLKATVDGVVVATTTDASTNLGGLGSPGIRYGSSGGGTTARWSDFRVDAAL